LATQDGPLDEQHRPGRRDREASVAGSLSDMGVADLVQTLEMGKKSGELHLKARTGARATCHFRTGRVVDCELGGALQGEEAFYRILRWHEGGFAIEFKPSEREERIQLPTQALLLQGMRRIDEWRRVVEQLPALDRRLEVDVVRLGERLAKVPDGANALLRLFDGRRTLAQVIEAAPGGDLAAADIVARLVGDGILRELGEATPRDGAPLAPEPPRAAFAPEPGEAPHGGGVDWFAGPVGPEAVVAPVASWVLTPMESEERAAPRPPSSEAGRDWLEPPLTSSEPSGAAGPATQGRAGPPRPAPRFSIPVPPPGTLPPPPSVAETLARYRVVPRPLKPPEPEPDPVAAPAAPDSRPAETIPEPVGPAPTRVVAPEPERIAPVLAPSEKRSRPFESASLPLHLEVPPVRSRPPPAPARRSVLPHVALGAIVIVAIAAGAAVTRRPALDAPPPAATAAPPSVPEKAAAVVSPGAPRPAPSDDRRAAPAAAAPAAPTESVETAETRGQAAPGAEPPARPAAQPSAPVAETTAPVAVAARPPVRLPDTASSSSAAPSAARPVPTPSPAIGEADTRKLLAAADRKYEAGRYADAIADYRRAIALRPTPAARVSLARALYDAHRSPDAMRELDRVIEANPSDASAWLLRGDIHQGEGRPDDAREAYRRFLEIEPHGEQARVVRMILGRDPQ
jgi:hypothetical protein